MGDDWQGAFDFLEVETTAKGSLFATNARSINHTDKKLYYSE